MWIFKTRSVYVCFTEVDGELTMSIEVCWKKPVHRSVSVFRITPHNRFLQQLVPKAGRANDSRHRSHYGPHSPSELCAALGYITNNLNKLPGGHFRVISEMEMLEDFKILFSEFKTAFFHAPGWAN